MYVVSSPNASSWLVMQVTRPSTITSAPTIKSSSASGTTMLASADMPSGSSVSRTGPGGVPGTHGRHDLTDHDEVGPAGELLDGRRTGRRLRGECRPPDGKQGERDER
jgi:hypothetical protein